MYRRDVKEPWDAIGPTRLTCMLYVTQCSKGLDWYGRCLIDQSRETRAIQSLTGRSGGNPYYHYRHGKDWWQGIYGNIELEASPVDRWRSPLKYYLSRRKLILGLKLLPGSPKRESSRVQRAKTVSPPQPWLGTNRLCRCYKLPGKDLHLINLNPANNVECYVTYKSFGWTLAQLMIFIKQHIWWQFFCQIENNDRPEQKINVENS